MASVVDPVLWVLKNAKLLTCDDDNQNSKNVPFWLAELDAAGGPPHTTHFPTTRNPQSYIVAFFSPTYEM